MKLRYERGALADLDKIFTYIAGENREAAMRLAARFEEVARRIAENPFLGEATRKSRFRRFPIGNYLIVYEIAATVPVAGPGRGTSVFDSDPNFHGSSSVQHRRRNPDCRRL
jgi:toxin ParE1/3/4